jgi:hypothetical protein
MKAGGSVDEALTKEMNELDTLKAQLAKDGKLTSKDAATLQRDLADLLKGRAGGAAAKADGAGGQSGTGDDQVQQLLASSPALAKMLKDADVSYDVINPSGDAVAGGYHAVLGIGHRDGHRGSGPHKMVYDPWKRRNLPEADSEQARELQEADARVAALEQQGEHLKHTDDADAMNDNAMQLAKARVRQTAARAVVRAGYGDANQLVSDGLDLDDYYQTTTKSIDEKGTHYHDGPFTGMY